MSRFGKPQNAGSKALYLIVLMLGGLTFLIMLLLVVIVIYSAPDDKRAEFPVHPDAEPGKGCGRIGNITIKYNTADLFFPATYDNVNYWGGEVYLNRTKWCEDTLGGIQFPVDWPSMKASKFGFRHYDDKGPMNIAVTMEHNYSGDPVSSMKAAIVGWIIDWSAAKNNMEKHYDEIVSDATRIDKLDLYSIEIESKGYNALTVYWGENADNDVAVRIRCSVNSHLDTSHCSQRKPDLIRGVWVELWYRIELLDQWEEMHEAALGFVDRLTINHEEIP